MFVLFFKYPTMEKSIDIKSVVEAEIAKTVICQTIGIKNASAAKRSDDGKTVLQTEGVNIQVSF